MKTKWFFLGIILILLAAILASARARIAAALDLNRPALSDAGLNRQEGIHNLWGTNRQSSATTSSGASSADHSGLWGSASASVDLSYLVFSTGALTPAFAPRTTTYTQTVDISTSSLTVTAGLADATSTVTVNGAPLLSGHASASIKLAYGSNTIAIVVTAPDGFMTRTYTVTVLHYYKVFLPVIIQ